MPYALATWFGCGRVPRAPGTAGTIGALPLYFVLRPYGGVVVFAAAAVVTVVGVWAASVVARAEGKKDPQHVVIDEVAGVLVTLAFVPDAPHAVDVWKPIALGVLAFRACDMLKPWPARAAERRLPGGFGIVLDDVLAGFWGALLVRVAVALGA